MTAMHKIGADDFARRFALRAGNVMWLLGAGASASAGIPTALDMVWEFKQRLFVSQRRVAPGAVADLSNAAVRARLQAHIYGSGQLPAAGALDEYAALFEAVYPAEVDAQSPHTSARGADRSCRNRRTTGNPYGLSSRRVAPATSAVPVASGGRSSLCDD